MRFSNLIGKIKHEIPSVIETSQRGMISLKRRWRLVRQKEISLKSEWIFGKSAGVENW